MTSPVFMVPSGTALVAGQTIRVSGDEGRHAAAVKRMRVTEAIDVCDGEGTRASGVVAEVGKDWVAVTIHTVEFESESELRLVVAQALAKGDRADTAVEVLTEIGVDEIVPWQAAHCVVKWDKDDKGRSKWSRIAQAATKQSRQSRIPVISQVNSSKELAESFSQSDLVLVLHESGASSIAEVTIPASGTVTIVVGPEGGISPDELSLFSDKGARIVRMGKPVLRTSTAGVVACAAILVQTPRWKESS